MAKRDAAMASFANRHGNPATGSVMREPNRLARGVGYSILRSLGFALFNWLPRSNPKLEPLRRQLEGDVERIARVDPTSAKQLRAERAANHQLLDPLLGSIARDDDGGDAAINPIKAIESGNWLNFADLFKPIPRRWMPSTSPISTLSCTTWPRWEATRCQYIPQWPLNLLRLARM